jgi:hypothetical protein
LRLHNCDATIKNHPKEVPLCLRIKESRRPTTRSRKDFSLVLDIHAGEGGVDSRLFAKDLLTAYLRFAARLQLTCELAYESESSWSVRVSGEGCWDAFVNESGKHVVQRIPPTESNGRRHTSTVAVAVLPLTDDKKFELSQAEVEITTQRGHGSGGQQKNKLNRLFVLCTNRLVSPCSSTAAINTATSNWLWKFCNQDWQSASGLSCTNIKVASSPINSVLLIAAARFAPTTSSIVW